MKISELNLKKLKNKRLLFIDGNNLVHRCFHGSKQATPENKKQITTFLVLNQILNFKSLCLNSIMVFFWDSEYSYRANLYDFYKQHKLEEDNSEKNEIINHVKDIIRRMNFQSFEQYGYEGDDLIAIYSSIYSKQNKVIIFSTDDDLLQCLNNRIVHYNPIKNETNTNATIKENKGLNPKDIALKKALIGKKGEVPGIPGVGKKTAQKIINNEIDFPEFDMDLFQKYLNVSILPFQHNEDPLKINEINKFKGSIKAFKEIFTKYDYRNFLTEKSMKVWSKHFSLRKLI